MNVFRGIILPNRSAVVQGRVVDKTKTLYLQADLLSISYRIVRKDSGAQVVAATALTVANVIFNTPFDWDGSIHQANFRHVIAESVFTVNDIAYQIQYTFTGTDGTVGGGLVEPETLTILA